MSDDEFFHDKLKVDRHQTLHPTPEILEAIKQAYEIHESVADLLDNSIDARAERVLVRFIKRRGKLISLCVADDGRGMNSETIDRAMTFADRREYERGELGMFGVGLKTASLSHADSVSVLSRARGYRAVGRRWSDAGIRKHVWRCDVLAEDSAEAELALDWGFIGKIRHGTVVRWDDVRDFERVRPADVTAYLDKVHTEIRLHVGLKLHRFLANRRVDVRVDVLDADTGEVSTESKVEALDPFPRVEARSGYPKLFLLDVPKVGRLQLKASIWPRRSNELGYKLGTGKVAEHQGLYFYRHDRLIQAGGWNGFRSTTEPHFSLARVAIDIPDSFAEYLKVRSTKAGVDAPPSFADQLEHARAKDGTTLKKYVELAEQVYRTRGEQKEKPMLRPGRGVPMPVRHALEQAAVPFKRGDGITIEWGRVTGKDFFSIDRDADLITLNDRYRSIVNRGDRGSGADAPLLRTLLYFLLAPSLERERGGVVEDGRLRAIQTALLAAVKLEGE